MHLSIGLCVEIIFVCWVIIGPLELLDDNDGNGDENDDDDDDDEDEYALFDNIILDHSSSSDNSQDSEDEDS